MRQRSHPPLVILFDLLFMLLFVSVLTQERVLDIRLPPDHLPADVLVLGSGDERALARHALARATAPPGATGFGFLLRCGGQAECRGLPAPAWVALPHPLYREIEQLATTPFASGECRRLRVQIHDLGGQAAVDYARLTTDNPCLLGIEGFAAWVARRAVRAPDP